MLRKTRDWIKGIRARQMEVYIEEARSRRLYGIPFDRKRKTMTTDPSRRVRMIDRLQQKLSRAYIRQTHLRAGRLWKRGLSHKPTWSHRVELTRPGRYADAKLGRRIEGLCLALTNLDRS